MLPWAYLYGGWFDTDVEGVGGVGFEDHAMDSSSVVFLLVVMVMQWIATRAVTMD